MPTIPPLPRSLDPLAGESVRGYVLRLAHRLDRAPGRIAVLTGLGRTFPGRGDLTVPAGRLLHLDASTTTSFAAATRLSAHEVAALCLDSLRDRYPPLDRDHQAAPHRTSNGGVATGGLASWVFTQSTRYCPQCLAGDGSAIQRAHGGAWQRLWHLPPIFACTLHRRLLLHQCPQCRQPVHTRHHRAASLFPRAQDATLHPAQCRTTIRAGAHWKQHAACGARLDLVDPGVQASPVDHQRPMLERLLVVQHKLLELLQPDGPTQTISVGRPVAVAAYFLDLRLLVGLLLASWPHARPLAQAWAGADPVDQHLDHQRQQAQARHQQGRKPLPFRNRPPIEPDACGNLLAIAEQLLTLDDPGAARQRLDPLIAHAAAQQPWVGHLLRTEPHCSDGLREAIKPWITALRPSDQPGRRRGSRHGPLRDCRFGPHHIPQFLPAGWYARHFHHLTGIDPLVLRRFVPAKLVQMTAGGSLSAAAEYLGLSPSSNNIRPRSTSKTSSANWRPALEALADDLDAATRLVDYAQRRDTLSNWLFPLDDWLELATDFRRRQTWQGRASTRWGERKRKVASVLVWARITQSEHRLAPLIVAERASSPRSELAKLVARVRYQSHHRPDLYGYHWVVLTEVLDTYADRLAARIDNGWPAELACSGQQESAFLAN